VVALAVTLWLLKGLDRTAAIDPQKVLKRLSRHVLGERRGRRPAGGPR
jgi:predicted exporter